MLFLLLLVLLVYMNTRLARKKGLNPLLWGLITLLAFFVFYCILGSIYIAVIYKGPLTREALTAWVLQSPLSVMMLVMLGIGGTLVVRFILERKKTVE